MLRGFPTDLAAEAGLITRRLDGVNVLEEVEQDALKEIPILGAGGEKGAQPEVRPFDFIDVKGSQVAFAAGGNVKAQAVRAAGSEEVWEIFVEEGLNFRCAHVIAGRVKSAELLRDLGGFQMDALDRVIVTATFDGGPIDDIAGGRAARVAHVGLLKNLFLTGA